MLEVIDKGQCTDAHRVPLLFVHGNWQAAWCWDKHFLDFFVEKGFRAAAVSLRGHGQSTSSKPFLLCSVSDYVDDVLKAADRLGGNPVVIGHSNGGFVVQRYLEVRRAPAAVLLASMPSRRIQRLRVTIRMIRRYPRAAIRSAMGGSRKPGAARGTERAVNMPSRGDFVSTVESSPARPRAESDRPNGLSARAARVTSPLLILGAEYDQSVVVREVQSTARAYRTQAEFFPMGHNMMLEVGWDDVAARIYNWLESKGM